MKLAVVLISFLIFSSVEIRAAEIRYLGLKSGIYSPNKKKPPKTHVLSLSGTIEKGDITRLTRQLKKIDQRSGKYSTVIYLNSGGGAFSTGLKLAKFFMDQQIGTILPARGRCFSACAVAFLGGRRVGGDDGGHYNYRRIHPTAKLGFHAPSLVVPKSTYNKQTVENAYDAAVKSLGGLTKLFGKIGISTSLMEKMLEKGTGDLFYIDTVDKAGRWGFEVILPAKNRITAKKLARVCGNALQWKRNEYVMQKTPGASEAYDGSAMFFLPNRSYVSANKKRYYFVADGMGQDTCLVDIGRWPNGRRRIWVRFTHDTVDITREMFEGKELNYADVYINPLHFFHAKKKLKDLAR